MTESPKDTLQIEHVIEVSPSTTFITTSDMSQMNYSPKHSKKSSSLSVNRNINMKNLSLNLDTSPKYKDNGATNSLLISIPEELNSPSYNGTNGTILATKKYLPVKLQTSYTPVKTAIKLTTVDSLNAFGNDPFRSPQEDVDVATDPSDKLFLNSFRNLKIPEELQELSQLNAYSKPANVLNGCIFLYSEPTVDQINQYDLVINVARECKDLSLEFNPTHLPGKQYVYVPWNHTSSILEQLPRLTDLIAQYDDSDNDNDNPTQNRKILIHCQCGVSRSACLVVAYYIKKFKISVNEAYDLLKTGNKNISTDISRYEIESCTRICPNMSLIFELMDFNKAINHQ